MAAITVVIAQNTTGVFGMQAVSPELVAQQIDCVFEDIRPDAVKLGMLYSADIIHAVADRLRAHHAKNVVLDPVMISSSGHALSKPDAMQALQEEIFPLCTLVTPNLHETAAFCGRSVQSRAEMEQAAQEIAAKTGGGVLVKGGTLPAARTICFMQTDRCTGSLRRASTTPIPTARAARCPPPLPAVWRRVFPCSAVSNGPSAT